MAASAPSNTLTRILSALVMAPLAFAVAWFGGWLFVVFWSVAALAVLYEWTTTVRGERALGDGARAAWFAGGVLYALPLAWAPTVLRADAQFGFAAIVFLFAVVWSTDILGYFGGRAFGGPKLAPAISPSKTWSGAFAGTAGAAIASALISWWVGNPHWLPLVAVGMALSVGSQIGDLGESAFKRKFRIKDASNLIPGHGGVMDRLDGFWAAVLVAAAIGISRGGFHDTARGLLIW